MIQNQNVPIDWEDLELLNLAKGLVSCLEKFPLKRRQTTEYRRYLFLTRQLTTSLKDGSVGSSTTAILRRLTVLSSTLPPLEGMESTNVQR